MTSSTPNIMCALTISVAIDCNFLVNLSISSRTLPISYLVRSISRRMISCWSWPDSVSIRRARARDVRNEEDGRILGGVVVVFGVGRGAEQLLWNSVLSMVKVGSRDSTLRLIELRESLLSLELHPKPPWMKQIPELELRKKPGDEDASFYLLWLVALLKPNVGKPWRRYLVYCIFFFHSFVCYMSIFMSLTSQLSLVIGKRHAPRRKKTNMEKGKGGYDARSNPSSANLLRYLPA